MLIRRGFIVKQFLKKWKPLTHSLTDTKVYRRCLSVSELKLKIKKKKLIWIF